MKRCEWADKHPLEQRYHDEVWGIPEHDDLKLFKMLCLEGMQAGLSWLTILKKMDSLCAAFDDFHPEKLVNYDEVKVAQLLTDKGIIRNHLKIKAVITNAQAFFAVIDEFGSFEQYIWQFVDFKPIVNVWQSKEEVPASTELSDKISKDLKKRGFKFVGTTIIYSFMQAVGMVNDYILSCAYLRV